MPAKSPDSPDTADGAALPVAADSPDTADAAADGVRLSELIAALPLSRGSVFELIKALGITTDKGPGPEGRGRVAWVGAKEADRLADAAARVHRGEVTIGSLTALQKAPATASGYSAASADPAPFLARLEAAERAIASGLGLSTTEVTWILGVKPGAAVVTRGGITATRTGWNCWRLTVA
jgi:hypothetical protein